MTLSAHQRAFLRDVGHLIEFIYDNNMEATFGEAYRTEQQQALYVRTGASKTMNSWHRKRLAIDLNLFVEGQYREDSESYRPLGDFWKSLNALNRWGGDFPAPVDGNHFERRAI